MYPLRIVLLLLLLLAACTSSGGGGNSAPDAGSDAAGTASAPYRILANPKLAASSAIRNRVIVIGTQPDGSPAHDDMVLSFDRPGAGTYARSAVRLGNLGATTTFSACDLATPGCAGPLKLTAAFASAPATPVAQLDVELVDPIEVNPAKPCLGGGNVLYLKGNDQIFNGEVTITSASWTFDSEFQEYLVFRVTPAGATDSWSLAFDARTFSPFHIPDLYENAQLSTGVASSERDHPAMNIKGFGNACSTIIGRYEVLDYRVTSSGAELFTIAFEQACNGATDQLLKGCVHYQR